MPGESGHNKAALGRGLVTCTSKSLSRCPPHTQTPLPPKPTACQHQSLRSWHSALLCGVRSCGTGQVANAQVCKPARMKHKVSLKMACCPHCHDCPPV